MVLDPLESLDLSDLPDYDAAQEYQALLRAVRRQVGFGIIFVRCSPDRGRRLMDELRLDLTQKQCQVLVLMDPLSDGDFFGQAMTFLDQHPADVVFVQGIEHSLLEYEETKRLSGWTTRERWSYDLKDIPPILRNLNQQRDRFRNELQACFIFLVPLFTIRYMTRRAPDFFDWRSGVFEFRDPQDSIRKRVQDCVLEDYGRIQELTPPERVEQAMKIRDLLDETSISSDERFHLLINLGIIKAHEGSLEDAFVSWRKALYIPIVEAESLMIKGLVLSAMMKSDEAAITSYDKALELRPDYPEAWINRGISLGNLGRHEEAIASYKKAEGLKPDSPVVSMSRDASSSSLWRYGEVIASYDKTPKDSNQNIQTRSDPKKMLRPAQLLECLWSLNYDLQCQQFTNCTPRSRRAVAFVVQAQDSRIQHWLIRRLVHQIPNSANARILPFVVPSHPMWRYRDLRELWKDLSGKLRCLPDPNAIVEALLQVYRTKPIVIAMLGWSGNQRSQELQQQILSQLWDPLVTAISQLSSQPQRSRLILFLAEDANSGSETIVSGRDLDPRLPIPLAPLTEITHKEVEWWLKNTAYQLLLDMGYSGTQINTLIDNDIREWDRDPVKTIEQICYTFELRNGIAEIEPMWRLAG